jgi:ATP:corrinoid adenosyltransferase
MGASKNKIYVLSSLNNQGKTTTAILLENYFKSKGLKVACLQTMKGPYDVGIYLKNNCYHYTVPIEATKNKEALENWIINLPCVDTSFNLHHAE